MDEVQWRPLRVPSRVAANARRTGAGERWLAGLDDRVVATAQRLGVQLERQVGLDGWCSVLVAGTTADGEAVVLKVGVPDDEALGEAPALRAWGGRGAVRLRWASDDGFTLLLDRLSPAANLGDVLLLPEAVAATGRTAALAMLTGRLGDVLGRLWLPLDGRSQLAALPRTATSARHWADEEPRLRAEQGFGATTGARVAAWARELAATEPPPRLLHADLHANNVLSHGDDWLAIDPKGFVGDPAFDLAQALKDTMRRLDLTASEVRALGHAMAAGTGLDPTRVLRWAAVKAMGWDSGGRTVELLTAAAA